MRMRLYLAQVRPGPLALSILKSQRMACIDSRVLSTTVARVSSLRATSPRVCTLVLYVRWWVDGAWRSYATLLRRTGAVRMRWYTYSRLSMLHQHAVLVLYTNVELHIRDHVMQFDSDKTINMFTSHLLLLICDDLWKEHKTRVYRNRPVIS